MSREEILAAAKQCVCGGRETDYGTPEDSFGLIGQYWTVYTGHTITAKDVAMMMALLKIARIQGNRATGDCFVDLAGYAACGGEFFIIGIAVPYLVQHIQRIFRGFGRALPVSVRGAANHAKREYNGQYGRNGLFHKYMSPFVPY